MKDLYESLVDLNKYATFLEGIVKASMMSTLQSAGPYTILVPSEEAFAQALVDLNMPKDQFFNNTEMLSKILTYHILPGTLVSTDITTKAEGTRMNTLMGGKVHFHKRENQFLLEDEQGNMAVIDPADFLASNGVIHEINRVMMPE